VYEREWISLTLLNEKKSNNCFNLSIPFGMKIAVASLGNFHANPFGPELQVKQMLVGPCGRRKKMGKMRNYTR
jgi:hypothetical protein